MGKLMTLDDLISDLPAYQQAEIDAGAEALSLAIESSRLQDIGVSQFSGHLKSLGAQLFARLPNGSEIALPLPGASL